MKSSAKKTDASEGQLLAFFIAILVIIGVTGGVWMWMQKYQDLPEDQSEVPASQVSVRPTPTSVPKKIPHGKIPFTASTSWPGPKFTGGFFDPYDPAMGSSMTIAIDMADTQPVQQVWATVKTDNKTSGKIPFKRVSGTDMDGQWQGTWTVNDTYDYTYMITIEADSANGHTRDEIALR